MWRSVKGSVPNPDPVFAPSLERRNEYVTKLWQRHDRGVCRRTRGLDLNVLNITFAKPVVITEITIVPGFNYVAPDGRDEWSRHRLVTGVTWRMGGAVYPQVINPTRTGATMKFPSVITKQMSMTITDSVRPPRSSNPGERSVLGGTDNAAAVDETTAISSIVISGYPVDPGS